MRHKGTGETWVGSYSFAPIREQDGAIVGSVVACRDITEQKRAQEALQQTAFRLRLALDAAQAGMWEWDLRTNKNFWSEELWTLYGLEPHKCEPSYEVWRQTIHPDDRTEAERAVKEAASKGNELNAEWRVRDGKGAERWLMSRGKPIFDENGFVVRYIGIVMDITQRKRSEEALSESERFLRQSEKIARSGDGKPIRSPTGCTGQKACMTSSNSQGIIFPTFEEGGTFFVPEHRPIIREAIENTLNHGSPFKLEAEALTSSGKRLWTELRGLMRVEEGEGPQVVGSLLDITERKIAEADQKLLSTAIEQAAEGIVVTDPDGIIQYVNPAEEKISGYNKDQLIGKGADIFKSDRHSEDFFTDLWATINAGNVSSGRFINRKNDGTEYHEDSTISPVYGESGSLTNFVALKHDVTKHVNLQTQLFPAQKMEAIGALAGGFAHDFNNKLQVIDGYVDLALFNQDLPETLRSDLEVIKQTVSSSAELINGMMVFSRKAPVEFHAINLNELVSQAGSILSRSIPKMIEIDVFLADDLWTVNGDKTQIKQILMNLAVNARDAMPDGGKLTIKTNNIVLDDEYSHFNAAVKPGKYALDHSIG